MKFKSHVITVIITALLMSLIFIMSPSKSKTKSILVEKPVTYEYIQYDEMIDFILYTYPNVPKLFITFCAGVGFVHLEPSKLQMQVFGDPEQISTNIIEFFGFYPSSVNGDSTFGYILTYNFADYVTPIAVDSTTADSTYEKPLYSHPKLDIENKDKEPIAF